MIKKGDIIKKKDQSPIEKELGIVYKVIEVNGKTVTLQGIPTKNKEDMWVELFKETIITYYPFNEDEWEVVGHEETLLYHNDRL